MNNSPVYARPDVWTWGARRQNIPDWRGVMYGVSALDYMFGRHVFPDVDTLDEIARTCAQVGTLVNNRSRLIAAMEPQIIDRASPHQGWTENANAALERIRELDEMLKQQNDAGVAMMRFKLADRLKKELAPEILAPDMSNAAAAIERKRKDLTEQQSKSIDLIRDWWRKPKSGSTYYEFMTSLVRSLMLYNKAGIGYNFGSDDRFIFPRASCVRIPPFHIDQPYVFVQVGNYFLNWRSHQSIYVHPDQVSYTQLMYVPGELIVESPISSVLRMILQDENFQNQLVEASDGDREPDAILCVKGESKAIGRDDLLPGKDGAPPMQELERLKFRMNEKGGDSLAVYAGDAKLIQITRDRLLTLLDSREEKVKKAVGAAYAATPMELSLADSGNTSGRSTAEVQQELLLSHGLGPFWKTLAELLTKPTAFYFGDRYAVTYEATTDPDREIERMIKKLQAGISPNDVLREQGRKGYSFPEGDRPTIYGQTGQGQDLVSMGQI